ncbi:hypothetical protein ACQKCH_02065 [Nubsella zeaxanthinifaciens]|uniref:hypothetical protein n=1 Tax=Nubsella zeaxanthinifaciens TaxID=392412 RepID=UPI003D0829F2
MKKHLLKISVIALVLVGNWGCKKETDFKEVKNVNINEMKNWFQSNINSDSFLSSVKPNWDKIYKGFDGNLSYYEIKCDNLLNTINGSFADMQTDQQRQEKASRTTVKLIIFDNENGQRTAAYMFINELGADNNSDNTHYKQMGELSGTVIFYSLNGKLSNGYVYENGSIIKTIKNAPENISSTDSSQRSVMIAEAGNCSVSATAVYQQVCITIGEIYDSKSGEAIR